MVDDMEVRRLGFGDEEGDGVKVLEAKREEG